MKLSRGILVIAVLNFSTFEVGTNNEMIKIASDRAA